MTDGGCADVIRKHHGEIADRISLSTDMHYTTSQTMTGVDNSSVELVVTSPPYPMIERWDEFGDYDTMHDMIEMVMSECYRVLVDGGIACINIGDATRTVDTFQCYPNHAEILVRARGIGYDTLVPIHWMKPTNRPNSFLGSGFMPPNAYTTLDTEYIIVLRKGGPRQFDEGLLRRASQFTKEERDSWFSQQWKVKGARQDGRSVFPPEVPYRLVRMFSVLGDTVLDPFAGTGTTLEVARSLGRSGIGYEVNQELAPRIEDNLRRVNSIPVSDILENLVKNEEREKFGPGDFIDNPTSLIDFI